MKNEDKNQLAAFAHLVRLYFATRKGKDGITSRAWRDGRRFKCETTTWVHASPETAFSYVADMTRHNEWATNEITVKPVTPGPVRLGSQFHSVGIDGGKEYPADLVVTAYEPPRRFEFTATGGPISPGKNDPHRHEFTFTPEKGGTRMDVLKTDPAPDEMPAAVAWLLTPLVILTQGRRFYTIQNLRECINQLGEQEQKEVVS